MVITALAKVVPLAVKYVKWEAHSLSDPTPGKVTELHLFPPTLLVVVGAVVADEPAGVVDEPAGFKLLADVPQAATRTTAANTAQMAGRFVPAWRDPFLLPSC